jgi:hypothetical protein
MGLQRADLEIIMPDKSRTANLIERGFENIQAMAAVGGPKATQSEKFLKQLMAATMNGAKRVRLPFNPNTNLSGQRLTLFNYLEI